MADTPLETETIGGRQCYLYIADGATTLLIQPVDSHDRSRLDTEVAALRGLTTTPFSLVAIRIDRWRDELTPWSAPSIFKEKPFGDGARATLDYITDTLLPCCNERWGKKKTILGGYSLAGLFALWAGYNTDCFDAIAAASPSVWYPGWMEYADTAAMLCPAVYLSQGYKESHTKNKSIAGVANAIRHQHQLLGTQGIETLLEWNPGNHFAEPDHRTARAFAWCIGRILS